MSLAEQREILMSVIQHVFVRDKPGHQGEPHRTRGYGCSAETVRIVWMDEPQVDVPRQGRQDYVLRPFDFGDDVDSPGGVGEAVASPA